MVCVEVWAQHMVACGPSSQLFPVLQTAALCNPQVKIEKEKVYIRASKQVRGRAAPEAKPEAGSVCLWGDAALWEVSEQMDMGASRMGKPKVSSSSPLLSAV